MIPDRDLDDHVFSISDMTVEVRRIAEQQRIMFNGSVEWALDSIVQTEVIWLPSEAQLRDRLGAAFGSLHHDADGFHCRIVVGKDARVFTSTVPADAYGHALLHLLGEPNEMLRQMLNES